MILIPRVSVTGELVAIPSYYPIPVPWIHAANKCFQKKALPTTYSNSMNTKYVNERITRDLWTGMFKTNVIYKHNAEIPGNKFYDKFFN